jgi:hypothetical protein
MPFVAAKLAEGTPEQLTPALDPDVKDAAVTLPDAAIFPLPLTVRTFVPLTPKANPTPLTKPKV